MRIPSSVALLGQFAATERLSIAELERLIEAHVVDLRSHAAYREQNGTQVGPRESQAMIRLAQLRMRLEMVKAAAVRDALDGQEG